MIHPSISRGDFADRGAYERAVRQTISALHMEQVSLGHLLNSAIAHHRSGRIAEAKAIYVQILAQEPNHPDALHLLGVTEFQSGNAQLATDLIARAIRLRPDNCDAYNNLGNALLETGRYEEAVAACREAIRINPNSSEAQNNLGAALSAAGQFDDAIAALRRSLELTPDRPEAFNNLGNAFRGKERIDEALASYAQAVHLRPDYADAHHNRGVMLSEKGFFDQAIDAYRQAIRLNPRHAEAHFNLGVTLKRLQRFEEAATEVREAIRLKPNSLGWDLELAAITGDRLIKTAPAEYVQKLFDNSARSFDEHLVERLKYQVPPLLLQQVLQATPRREFDILDIGCGTGLCGMQFRRYARRMVGVDLSPNMLKFASSRKIYDELIAGDIISALRSAASTYDLIVAGDVLIYVGDLTDLMPAVANALRPGGLFACSIEDYRGEGFILHSEVRFAHSLAYFREQATASGLTELAATSCTVRQNAGRDVPGWIMLVSRPAC